MKNMKRNVQQGFTLIELMIVIAIVAILVALAVPAYQDYTIRSKVAECINNAAVVKLAVSEFRQTTGAFPSDGAAAGIDTNTGVSQYCAATTYATGGIITVTADSNKITGLPSNLVATLEPTALSGGAINWRCKSAASTMYKYLPSTCRSNT